MLASISLLAVSAKAGELAVSGTAKATYNVYSGKSNTGKGLGITNELNFTASGETDAGYTWSYSMELDPNTTGDTATSPSNTPPGAALNDDTQISLTMNDMGTAKICVSTCGNSKEYAFDQSAYTSMSDTGLSEGIEYPISASSYASLQYHTPELPFGTTGSVAYGQTKVGDGQSGNAQAGSNGNNITAYSLVTKPVDGLTLAASYYIIDAVGNIGARQENEGGSYNFNYSMGPVSFGYGETLYAPAQRMNNATATQLVQHYENEAYSVGFAVNDALSVSYTAESSEKQSRAISNTNVTTRGDVEMDIDTIDVAYNKKNLLRMIFHKNKMTFRQDDQLAIYKNSHQALLVV